MELQPGGEPAACKLRWAALTLTHTHALCRPLTPHRSVVHRRGEEILRLELPAKREAVVKLALTPAQHRVYTRFVQVLSPAWLGWGVRESRGRLSRRPVLVAL